MARGGNGGRRAAAPAARRWNSRGAAAKCSWAFACSAAGFGNSGFGCGADDRHARAAAQRPAAASTRRGASARHLDRRGCGLRRRRRGAHRAQIAFDHRQPVDHVAERVVDGFERILGAAVGFRLAEADVGHFALDDVDDAGVHRRGAAALRLLSASATRLACWRSRWRRMSCRPSSTRPRSPAARRSRSPEASSRSSRYETRCSRWAKADASSLPTGMRSSRSDSARSAPSRCSECSLGGRPLAVFQRRGQRGDALLQHGKGIAVAVGARELVDLGRQRVHVVGQPRQRVVGGDVGDDGAQRGDRAFELLHRRRDRRWRAGSGRAWRRDCGSPRRSRRAVRPASASAAPRGFRRARVRCRPAPGRRCRSGGCRRCGGTASGFRSRSIRSRAAASPR